MSDRLRPEAFVELAVTVAEVVGAVVAGAMSLLAESTALSTLGDDLTLGVWFVAIGVVLLLVSVNLGGDALSRTRALR